MTLQPDEKKIKTINNASVIDQQFMMSKKGLSKELLRFRRNLMPYFFTEPPLWRILLRSKMREKRMVPAFVSIGAVRSGTSLLSDYVMQHPHVVLPLAKEIGAGSFPLKRLIDAQFPTETERAAVERQYGLPTITGYCAPAIPNAGFPYLLSQATSVTDLKLVIILRDPIQRTFAHWRWDSVLLRQIKKDPLWAKFPTFDEAMLLELEYIRLGGGGMQTLSGVGGAGYIQHSNYLPFLQDLFRTFDKRNAIFVQAEKFFADPVGTAKTVYRFLGLPDYDPVVVPVKNAGPPGKMAESTIARLNAFFEPLNRQLYSFIGSDFTWDR